MTQEGQYIFFISKKEDDANFSSQLSLLSRAFFIYTHLPKELQIRYQKKEQPAMLVFKNKNSTIHGVSQDSDALRQYTTSSLFFDEMAFQEKSEQSFASIKPTLDGHKRTLIINGHKCVLPKFCGVSTPNGKRNLFAKLVHDGQE
jgi:phage FluMu gp28-like protein